MELFLPLIKADAEKRLIYARAVHEVPDRANEIFDYVTSKPNILAWSKDCENATNGLSKGNVRVMHTKTVAGKVTDLTFNDDDKAVDVVIKVVDDNEWRKVEEGVYCGVSVGGSYAKKWQDGGYTRYTAKPSEISLVDRPCIPTAVFFDLQKSDGIVEHVRFQAYSPRSFAERWADRPRSFAEQWASRATSSSGPKTFGEMSKRAKPKLPVVANKRAVEQPKFPSLVKRAPVAVLGLPKLSPMAKLVLSARKAV